MHQTNYDASRKCHTACAHTDRWRNGWRVIVPQDHWQVNAQVCQCCQNHSSLIQQLPAKLTEYYICQCSRKFIKANSILTQNLGSNMELNWFTSNLNSPVWRSSISFVWLDLNREINVIMNLNEKLNKDMDLSIRTLHLQGHPQGNHRQHQVGTP